jgi:hypothetical protein
MADITTGELLVVEYERIKDEQKGRISTRDGLLYATLAAAAGVIAAVLRFGGGANLPLLLRPSRWCSAGPTWSTTRKVSAIGRYIRDELAPRLEVDVVQPPLAGAGAGGRSTSMDVEPCSVAAVP